MRSCEDTNRTNTRFNLIKRLLYRDSMVLILDKPAGLPVHAGPGGGPTLEQNLESLRFGLPAPPALAHRLDRDTSGCLVLGRHRKALRRLGQLFLAHQVEKTYWAVVQGKPRKPVGLINLPLAKVSIDRTRWQMRVDPAHGQPSVTAYRMIAHHEGLTWLELCPYTGRTHQIRVHCAALRCPVLGDPIYGSGECEPLHLHARSIVMPLYPERPPILALAPVPPHIQTHLQSLGWQEQEANNSCTVFS